ncbi:MAG: tRNA pseudouridine(55) synthase TruB [Planctomycetia bacterium]|nr:tRNA pseudouridine(55) synthase TruB [Planctomycetia bacterium]
MSLFGLLNINKPSGLTSRHVVDQVLRLVKPAKVGHAGTLDPLASGVLVIGIGQATRIVEYVQQMPKCYRATFLLGHTSDTEDIEGVVTILRDAPRPSRTELDLAIAEMIGEIEQRPPAYSALKISGRRAYALARAGEAVDLAPRKIEIYRAEIVHYDYPELCINVECSSGTYVRSFGRDLAEQVGTAAVMSALERTAIGRFTLEEAIDTGQLTRENIAGQMLSPTLAIRGLMPERVMTEPEIQRLGNGLSIAAPPDAPAHCAALDEANRLVAILDLHADGAFWPAKYFPSGFPG